MDSRGDCTSGRWADRCEIVAFVRVSVCAFADSLSVSVSPFLFLCFTSGSHMVSLASCVTASFLFSNKKCVCVHLNREYSNNVPNFTSGNKNLVRARELAKSTYTHFFLTYMH